jgi:phosphoglycerate dehydrogenase-like enzyme
MKRPAVVAVVAPGEQPPRALDRIAAVADLEVAGSHEALAAALRTAEVLFAWDFRTALIPRAWPHATKLRWIHTASIGVDSVMTTEVANGDVVVSNTRGVFEHPIAEYVLAMLLLFAKDLRETLRLQARHEWSHRESALVRDQNTLICGAGPVARAIARLLGGIGANFDVVARSVRAGDPDFGVVHAATRLPDLLGRADYLVVALPLTSETYGFFDRARLQQLKPRARIVNIGRGPIIDEQALIDSLASGHVGGAALDVFMHEPLPPDHPFWGMETVVVSPHMSGDAIGWTDRVVDRFLSNLERFSHGVPLEDVIDKAPFVSARRRAAAAASTSP